LKITNHSSDFLKKSKPQEKEILE